MDTRAALSDAASLLAPVAAAVTRIEPDRLDASIDVPRLLDAVRIMRDAGWGYLAAITGVDHPSAAATTPPDGGGRIEVLYHFCEGGAVTTLRVSVPYSAAAVPSIGGLIRFARLYEIELAEMFGVAIDGLPFRHLLLPEQWPDGVYPLRKAFSGDRFQIAR